MLHLLQERISLDEYKDGIRLEHLIYDSLRDLDPEEKAQLISLLAPAMKTDDQLWLMRVLMKKTTGLELAVSVRSFLNPNVSRRSTNDEIFSRSDPRGVPAVRVRLE